MTATATQDEDLIILGEESENNDIFNFNMGNVEQTTQASSEIIDFENTSSDQGVQIENDFSFSFTNQEATETMETTEEISNTSEVAEIENTQSDILDMSQNMIQEEENMTSAETLVFDETPEENQVSGGSIESFEVIAEDTQNESMIGDISELSNVNSILQATIVQLQSRKDNISTTKLQKTSQVTDLLEKIESLQSEVESLNTEISELDVENKKIDKNIVAIEKMKTDAIDTSEVQERQRKHAAEKIKNVK